MEAIAEIFHFYFFSVLQPVHRLIHQIFCIYTCLCVLHPKTTWLDQLLEHWALNFLVQVNFVVILKQSFALIPQSTTAMTSIQK